MSLCVTPQHCIHLGLESTHTRLRKQQHFINGQPWEVLQAELAIRVKENKSLKRFITHIEAFLSLHATKFGERKDSRGYAGAAGRELV